MEFNRDFAHGRVDLAQVVVHADPVKPDLVVALVGAGHQGAAHPAAEGGAFEDGDIREAVCGDGAAERFGIVGHRLEDDEAARLSDGTTEPPHRLWPWRADLHHGIAAIDGEFGRYRVLDAEKRAADGLLGRPLRQEAGRGCDSACQEAQEVIGEARRRQPIATKGIDLVGEG